MTKTTKMTKKQVLALARAKWGAKVQLKENAPYGTPAERNAAQERLDDLSWREETLRQEIQQAGDVLLPLLQAARSVLNGGLDAQSSAKLQAAIEQAERAAQAKKELSAILGAVHAEQIKLHFRYRYEIMTIEQPLSSPFSLTVKAKADTLDELVEDAR